MLCCEICGCRIHGNSQKIMIDGATLIACQRCAKTGVPYSTHKQERKEFSEKILSKNTKSIMTKTRLYENRYDIAEDYAIRIKSKREELGLTTEILARQINEKESVIKRLESGKLKPDIHLAKKLERALRITLLIPQEQVAIDAKYEELHVNQSITLGDIVELKKGSRNDNYMP
ncbi:MAG: multiprotein bridging factor aMBF1 [Candidatus Methanomethylicia archaeon]